MNQFDDPLPEEQKSQQQELLAMLQRDYLKPAPLSTDEQEQSLARVRERLLLADQQAAEVVPGQQASTPASIPPAPIAAINVPRRRRRIVNLLNGLAAVLIVGALIGGTLLLFSHYTSSQPAAPAITPTPGGYFTYLPIVASSSADGLQMTVSMTPGPYFLSELLAVVITLTNYSEKTYTAGIPFIGSACGYVTGLTLNGGEKPYFTIPIPTDHSCPPIFRGVTLKPGKSLSALVYLPLTASGQVSLESYAEIYNNAVPRNPFPLPTPISPFKSGPVVHFYVSTKVPAGRALTYKRQGLHVTVNIPLDAQSPLIYLYAVSCDDFNNDGGSTGTGNYGWYPISGNRVTQPGCPGKNIKWYFAFGVPGYGIAVGNNLSP
jgi:hypothetical protein